MSEQKTDDATKAAASDSICAAATSPVKHPRVLAAHVTMSATASSPPASDATDACDASASGAGAGAASHASSAAVSARFSSVSHVSSS